MTSQTGQQIIAIHILANIPRSKEKQGMKFGQLIEYNVRNFFLQISSKNVAVRLVAELFLFFEKALYKVKANGQQLSLNIFW